jgi:hypothetical protein
MIQDRILKGPQSLTFLAALVLVEMHILTAAAWALDRFGKAQTHNGFPLIQDECQKNG